VLLNRYIPESPRFLANAGRPDRARAVLAHFTAGRSDALAAIPVQDDDPLPPPRPLQNGLGLILRGRHARITAALLVCGLAWGLVNFGFVLWLPANLQKLALDAQAISRLMAQSALLAVPGIAVVVWLYQRWSSFKTLVLLVALTVVALFVFAAIQLGLLRFEMATIIATVLLLMAISGVIATLVPYAAEIYPVHIRGTGSGLIAAGSKAGGILGAVAGVAGLFDSFLLAAIAIALPMLAAGDMLCRSGVETKGHELEAIQQRLTQSR